ncbi:MAG: hypothetical protein NC177_11605 [Ruminococcus flavefaciens]|nr:hypothetical protein [Ruminococcus flavefaciens]
MNRNIYLSELETPVTVEYDFSYAGISGYAETIGCKVVFFRKNKSDLLDAFSFMEIEPEEFNFCNSILEKIGFPVKLGESHDRVREIFGTEKSTDTFFENYIRYNYYMEDYFVSFCITEKAVTGIEVIFSREIISEISDF